MPKGWSEASRPLFAVTWQETTAVEGGEEGDEETYVELWLFNSKAEAEMFLAEEIWERTDSNRDNLPPKHIRHIQQAIKSGRIFPLDEPDMESAVELWVNGSELYFDTPGDLIEYYTPPIMVRR